MNKIRLFCLVSIFANYLALSLVLNQRLNQAFAQTPPAAKQPAPTHKECDNMLCKTKNGAGTNSCNADTDCQRTACDSASCKVVAKNGLPNGCDGDIECNTECKKNGISTGDLISDDGKCGPCSTDACKGKDVNASCEIHIVVEEEYQNLIGDPWLDAYTNSAPPTHIANDGTNSSFSSDGSSGGGTVQGKCKTSVSCSAAEPSSVGGYDYTQACGMKCSCSML